MNLVYSIIDTLLPFEWTEFAFMKNALLAVLLITPLFGLVGAMIVNNYKIQAAGCFLPLTQNVNIPKELGTRHRAGIGITETSNVIALIVSEETGIITIAQRGKISRYADYDLLKRTLNDYYWKDLSSDGRKRALGRRVSGERSRVFSSTTYPSNCLRSCLRSPCSS